MEGFTKTVQTHKGLNREHRNFVISILAEDPIDVKKQIEDNVVVWVCYLFDIQVATQTF